MLVLKPFLTRLSVILPAPFMHRLSQYRRRPFAGARMLAVLLLSGGVLIIGIAAGAQGLWSSGDAAATKIYRSGPREF